MSNINEEHLYQLLRRFNPWWNGAEAATMRLPAIRRRAFTEVLETIENPRLRRHAVISGPRRVGKTTTMKQVVAELLARGVPAGNILYVSFDNPLLKLAGFAEVLRAYEESTPHSGTCYYFLDEVQYADDWSLWLKDLYDQRPEIRAVATGSASPEIRRGMSDSGVGRWRNLRMPTMSFREYCTLTEVPLSLPATLPAVEELPAMPKADFTALMNALGGLTPHWNRYLQCGGFPELAFNPDIHECQQCMREDVVEKVLKRDIPALFEVRSPLQLERVFMHLCLASGDLVNYSTLCQDVEGMAKSTLQRYIGYLQDANLIHVSNPAGGTGKKMLKGNPKIYVADAGMRLACLSMPNVLEDAEQLGKSAEAAVYKHFHDAFARSARLGYARLGRRDKEVDIVADFPNGKRIACEVKYRHDATIGATEAIRTLCAHEDTLAAFVATRGSADFGLDTRTKGAERPLVRIPASALCYLLG